MTVRKRAALKGQWYPETREACLKELEGYQREKWIGRPEGRHFQAGIVPHAGWFFSGSIASRVIEILARGGMPDLVVLMGHHLGPRDSTCVMPEGLLETPFGDLEVDEGFAASLAEFPFIRSDMGPFMAPENTLELQLPFVRHFFGTVPVCLLAPSPNAHAQEVGRAVVTTAREMDLSIKVIGSTDLTHYGPNFGFTPQGRGDEARAWVEAENDREAIDKMVALEPDYFVGDALSRSNACCAGAVAATLSAARTLGVKEGREIAYTNSFRKSPSESFVGYTGVVF